MTDTLHTKYRPETFKQVIGQGHFIKDLAGMLADRTAHAYLFHGSSGCGKTTLARIPASKLGCNEDDIIEVDGATNNGIENIRQLQQTVRYSPLSGGNTYAVIIDECHRISGAAFDTMLKVIKEPPPHLFWFFCTTEPQKVPSTIRGRCQQFAVRAVDPTNLEGLMADVAKAEGFDVPIDVIRFIAGKSLGSPRRALINLERCAACTTMKEAAAKIEQVLDEDAVLALARFICQFEKKRPWAKAMELYKKIGGEGKDDEGVNVEGARIQIMFYIAACLKGATDDATAATYLSMLEAFAQEIKTREGKAGLLLAIGRAVFVSSDV